MSQHVRIDCERGICTVRIDRPTKRNALTADMYRAITAAFLAAETDPAVRVVVVCGSAGHFSAGNDLQDFLVAPDPNEPRPAHALLRALSTATVPVVAAVDGVAVGIGTTLLLHCDFVFATPQARFSLPFVNLGLCPEAGSSLLLPRLAGYQRAAAMLLLGEPFDADKAREIGLVTAICPASELAERALETARQVAARPRTAVRATKALMKRAEEPVASRIEIEIARFNALLETPAAREIMAAFLEKRIPDQNLLD